jgi:NAD(P)H dehydrogenase (quinone)
MRIIVTGASGPFGRGVTQHLLDRGVAPSDLILVTRKPQQLADLAAQGAAVRYGDFDDFDAMLKAFAGGDKMLMISALKVGFRIPQHTRAIQAAKAAGVRHVLYTSFIGKEPGNPSLAVVDHRGTEQALRDSGLTWTALRNSQYADAMIEAAAPVALAAGRWQAASGSGRIPLVTRADCIAAAAGALLAAGTENRIYNITGPEGLTYREVAAILAENAGKPIEWIDCTAEQAYAEFDAMGIPRTAVPDQSVDRIPWSSDDMVSMQVGIADGWFDILSNDVEHLTGRKPQSFADFARQRAGELRTMAANAASR